MRRALTLFLVAAAEALALSKSEPILDEAQESDSSFLLCGVQNLSKVQLSESGRDVVEIEDHPS